MVMLCATQIRLGWNEDALGWQRVVMSEVDGMTMVLGDGQRKDEGASRSGAGCDTPNRAKEAKGDVDVRMVKWAFGAGKTREIACGPK